MSSPRQSIISIFMAGLLFFSLGLIVGIFLTLGRENSRLQVATATPTALAAAATPTTLATPASPAIYTANFYTWFLGQGSSHDNRISFDTNIDSETGGYQINVHTGSTGIPIYLPDQQFRNFRLEAI